MIKSNKGIMFTIISVLVCALIITSFFTFQSVSLDSDVENTKLRIKSIDRFANDADSYVSSLVYVSGKETLDFTLDIMISNNSFLTNYTNEFRSCMLTGNMTVPWPAPHLIRCPDTTYLAGEFQSFEDFSNSNLNLESRLSLNDVGIEQEDPWSLVVYTNYTIVIYDTYAYWNETRITKTRITIAGLRDPTYAITNMTGNANSELYPIRDSAQIINISPYIYWTEVPALAHYVVMNGSYFAWAGGPSYLERLEGIKNPLVWTNFSGSNGATCRTGVGRCGIVSIVSQERMQHYSQGHEAIINPARLRSSVDYEFWTNVPLNTEEIRQGYGRYHFWFNYFSFDLKRAAMGITVQNGDRGLNGSIVSDSLISKINMTDPVYVRPI